MDATKYAPGYYPVPAGYDSWVKKDHIEKAPTWCSVDLRDGNQALIVPMSLEEKLEFFQMLVKIGFKEIEVGFPAASDTEYEFLRTLIEKNMIPEDVTVQVLTQCRDHIIRRTFEAVKGAPRAVVHFYNSTSVAQREQVFHKSKEEIKQIAMDGAKLVKQLSEEYEGNFLFEYSPESFTGTEVDYAVEVCNAVLDIMQPTPDRPMIINLPVTVEMSMPHVYASQVEYMSENLKYREFVTLSLHPHNDRGTGVADTELALLAGADRVEGTLFGNGERTGNVDIITLAMNMYSHGVDPKLDFSDMPYLVDEYEKCTRMHVYERAPYAGALVFAAFSGSHQDAIAKGMKYRAKNKLHQWNVPYIPIDPKDIGRTYDADVIRVNSQSGKGGAAFVMQNNFGYNLPKKMHPEFGALVQKECDKLGRELVPNELLHVFEKEYLYIPKKYELAVHKLFEEGSGQNGAHEVHFQGKLRIHGNEAVTDQEIEGRGNGPIDAFFNALKTVGVSKYKFLSYHEHAISEGSDSKAIAYIEMQKPDGKSIFGVGIESNINMASIAGVLNAINRASYSESNV